MPTQDPQQSGEIDTTYPWIVIPYFKGDEGRNPSQRPLTGTSYLCPSIEVQGLNYSAVPGTYLPDEPLSIKVVVDNRGVPTASVTVNLFWANPSTGFVKPTLIGSTAFPVAGRAVSG